jgi:hypothetical protein
MKNGNKNVLERMHKLLIPRKIIKKIKYSENEKKKKIWDKWARGASRLVPREDSLVSSTSSKTRVETRAN